MNLCTIIYLSLIYYVIFVHFIEYSLIMAFIIYDYFELVMILKLSTFAIHNDP